MPGISPDTYGNGVYFGDTGTLSNSGTITGTTGGGIGVELDDGGSLTNTGTV